MSLNDEIRSAVNWDAPSVDMDDSLRTAIQKMMDGGTTALLVKIGSIVIGVVTDMDLMRSVVNKEDLDETKVSEFMTACELITGRAAQSPAVQLHEAESVENALGVLEIANLHNLVVSGENDRCAGTVSVRDLLGLVVSD